MKYRKTEIYVSLAVYFFLPLSWISKFIIVVCRVCCLHCVLVCAGVSVCVAASGSNKFNTQTVVNKRVIKDQLITSCSRLLAYAERKFEYVCSTTQTCPLIHMQMHVCVCECVCRPYIHIGIGRPFASALS